MFNVEHLAREQGAETLPTGYTMSMRVLARDALLQGSVIW